MTFYKVIHVHWHLPRHAKKLKYPRAWSLAQPEKAPSSIPETYWAKKTDFLTFSSDFHWYILARSHTHHSINK